MGFPQAALTYPGSASGSHRQGSCGAGIAFYGISKAALEHLTRSLTVEHAAAYPLGRLGVPEDVVADAAFLADAAWVTGAGADRRRRTAGRRLAGCAPLRLRHDDGAAEELVVLQLFVSCRGIVEGKDLGVHIDVAAAGQIKHLKQLGA